MLLMTCAIQTYDVKAAAGLLLLFCVLIPISSTCQLHLVTASVPGHTWSPCDKNASFLRGQRASPLLWHQRAAWPAFHWPLKWQISDKCTLEKALLFLPVFWGCRVSVVPIVSLISLEIVLVFLECIPRNCQKSTVVSGYWELSDLGACCGWSFNLKNTNSLTYSRHFNTLMVSAVFRKNKINGVKSIRANLLMQEYFRGIGIL